MQLWNIPEQRELISKIKADGHTANQTIKADKNKQNLKNAFFFISMAVAILKQFIPLYSLTRMAHFSISLLLVHMTSSKFKTKYELSIPLSFYFHKVLELLNTNIYTKFSRR